MADPGKYAANRRRSLKMQRELDYVREKGSLERNLMETGVNQSPATLPRSLSPSPHHLLQPVKRKLSDRKKKGKSAEKKIVLTTSRPQLKSLAISSLHHTSGPVSHAQRPRPVPHVSSWKLQGERETNDKSYKQSENQQHPIYTKPRPLVVPKLHPLPELRPSSAVSSLTASSSEEMVAVETKIQERGLSELSSVVSSSPSVSQPSPSPLPSLSLPSLSPYTPGHAALSGSESGSEDEEDEEEDLAAESGKRGEGRERAGEDREMEDEVTKEGEAAGYEWFSSVGVGLEPETRSSEMVDCADMKTIHDGDRADFVEMGDCGEINACSEGVDKTVDVVEDERQTVEDDKPDCCLGNKELGSKDHLSPVEERATITESIRSNQIAKELAFSSGPVTMEDVMSLRGTTLSLHLPPYFPLSSRHTATTAAAGVQYMASHTSMHHFCTEPLSAELPAAVQAQQRLSISRGSHDLSCDPSHDQAGRSHDSGGSATDQSGGVWTAAGKRLEIAKNPKNLLWQPVPPKLSLRPRTVTFHLLPHLSPQLKIFPPRCRTSEEPATDAHVRKLNDVIREHNDVIGTSETLPSPPASPTAQRLTEPDSPSSPTSLFPTSLSPPQLLPKPKVDPSPLGAMAMREYDIVLGEVTNQRRSLLRDRESGSLAAQRQSSHLDHTISQPRGRVRRQSRGGVRQLDTSLSLSSSGWRLRRQALQGRGGGRRKRRSQVLTSSATLRTKLAREALDSSRGRQRSRRASYPLATSEAEFEEQKQGVKSRHRRFSVSHYCDDDFTALMTKYGAPVNSDPWTWTQELWWGVWFPEALRECRRALAQYYHGDQLRALIGSSIPEGGFGEEEQEIVQKEKGVREERQEKEDVIELRTTSACEGDLNSWEEECEEVDEKMEKEGETACLLSQRAALLRKMGRLQEAWRDVNRSLSLSPSFSPALWTRHLLQLTAGSHSSALADLQTITSSSPSSSLVSLDCEAGLVFMSLIALVHHNKKTNPSLSLPLLSQAIAMCPDSPELLRERASVYEILGHHNKALDDYNVVLNLAPRDLVSLEKVGDHCLREKKWAEGEANYCHILHSQPTLTRVRVQRAQALMHLGRQEEALRELCTAVHLSPEDPQPRFWRGCLTRQLDPHWALRDLSVALLLSSSSSSSHLTARIHLYRALVYVKLHCYQEALSDLTSAISLRPSFFPAHLISGLLHQTFLGNPARAICCLSSALRVDPTSTSALLARAKAFYCQGMLKEAERDYTRLVHMSPHTSTAYILRGNLSRLSHNTPRAKEHALIVRKLTMNDGPSAVKALVAAFLHENDEAVSIATALPSHSLLRGKLLTKAGRYQEAIQVLGSPESHVTETDQSECRIVLGVAHLYAGEEDEVLKVLGEGHGAGQVPRLFLEMVYYMRGVASLCLGQNKSGLEDINRSLVANPQSYKAYLTRSAQFAREGRLAKAILNCNEAISLSPHSCRAFLYRGVVKYLNGNYQSSVEDLTQAIQLTPSHVYIPLYHRALTYHALGHLVKALADYSSALSFLSLPPSPLLLPLLVNRSLLSVERGDMTTALHDLSLAQQLTPEDPSLPQALALCHHRAGNLPASLAAYTSALGLDPVFIEALLGRGDVYMDSGTEEGREKARHDYSKALELDPRSESARISMAYLLQSEGRFMDAWNTLTEGSARDHDLSPDLLAARGIVSLQMEQLQGAMSDLSRSIFLFPSPETLTNRGVVHCFLGDRPNAMRDYQRALTIDPKCPLAHFNIGNMLFSEHRFRDAIRSYSKALEGGSHGDVVLVNRALAREMVGEREGAMADLSGAISLNPHAAHAFFNRGNLYRCRGDLQAAQQDYQSALRLLPGDWLCGYYLGQVTGELGDRDRATAIFQQAAISELPLPSFSSSS